MPVDTTYSSLGARHASVLKRVAEDHEVIIVCRRSAKDVALLSGEELAGLTKTAHLLQSPKKARRLLTVQRRVEGRTGRPESVEKLR